MCLFCRSLFVLLYFFFWPLCCLFFYNIRILITPLVSSNRFYIWCQNFTPEYGKMHIIGSSTCSINNCLTIRHIINFCLLSMLWACDTYWRIWHSLGLGRFLAYCHTYIFLKGITTTCGSINQMWILTFGIFIIILLFSKFIY